MRFHTPVREIYGSPQARATNVSETSTERPQLDRRREPSVTLRGLGRVPLTEPRPSAPRPAGLEDLTVTSKRWMLVVTELGSSTPLRHAVVNAGNWMAAIKEGRHAMGEPAAVPAGSSCQVSPDGKVTVHAPTERQTYLLYPEGSAAAPQLGAMPDAAPAQPASPTRERSKTMAYVPDEPIPAPPAAPAGRRPRPKTMAYIPAADLPQVPLPTSREISVGAPAIPEPPAPPAAGRGADAAPPAARRPEATSTEVVREAPFELISSRDEAPSDDSPLHYRERSFATAPGTSQAEAESIARAGLRSLQAELAGAPTGQLLHMAVYDHKWSGQPIRPAIVTLEWKDWRDELSVQYPLAEYASRMTSPALADAGSQHLDMRQRLRIAAESFEDMPFLRTPEEAVAFATRLLEELVPAPMIAGSLYDAAADALRICAERGTAGRLGSGLPRGRGLLAAATEAPDRALTVVDPRNDARFDASVDAALGIAPSCLMWVPLGQQGRLLGMLQLSSPAPGARFSAEDATVAYAVAERVAAFIHDLGAGGSARRRA